MSTKEATTAGNKKIEIEIPNNHRFEYDPDADVTFLFLTENGALILARKSKLASKSEIFQTQFATEKEIDCFSITDISFKTFNDVIKHIYGNEEIEVKKNNFLELLHASRKYAVNDLTLKVVTFALRILDSSNLHEYFDEIDKYQMGVFNDRIRNLCILYPLVIISNLQITSEVHMRILRMILESQKLECNEFSLYQGIVDMMVRTKGDLSWEEAKTTLGKLLYLIRFPTMTTNDIIKCGKTPSLLTPSQVYSFLLWKHEKTLDTWPDILLFSSQPRDFTSNIFKSCKPHFSFNQNHSEQNGIFGQKTDILGKGDKFVFDTQSLPDMKSLNQKIEVKKEFVPKTTVEAPLKPSEAVFRSVSYSEVTKK